MVRYLFILILFLIPLVNADNYLICKHSYYFIIDHLQSDGSVKFLENDLTELKFKIDLISNDNVSIAYLRSIVIDFNKCSNYSNLTIPKSNNQIIDFENINSFNCPTNYNNSFFDFSFSPYWFPKIYSGDMSCESVTFWKFFLDIAVSEVGYVTKGVRIAPIFFIFIIWLIISFFRSNLLVKNVINDLEKK